MNQSALFRVLPFALFMVFIGVNELARYLRNRDLIAFEDETLYFLYPIKAALVVLVLALLWKHFEEIRWGDLARMPHTFASILSGLIIFVLWINMDWSFGGQEKPVGFNPEIFDSETVRTGMIAVRMAGAALVVPVMEELFWRSFLLRYVVNSDFAKVRIGTFTWPSFLITVVLFGVEHHYVLAGMIAGAAFNLLLYYTRSIAQCILSHAVANLALGIYVLLSGQWRFW